MMISGTCAPLIGSRAGWSLAMMLVLVAIRGITVVADSARFSACAALCAPPVLVGTLLTVPAIQLMAWAVPALGWGAAFAILGLGPLVGALAMWRLAPLLRR